jgi:YHS domain-containing protein
MSSSPDDPMSLTSREKSIISKKIHEGFASYNSTGIFLYFCHDENKETFKYTIANYDKILINQTIPMPNTKVKKAYSGLRVELPINMPNIYINNPDPVMVLPHMNHFFYFPAAKEAIISWFEADRYVHYSFSPENNWPKNLHWG